MELHAGGCAHNTGVDLKKLGEEVKVVGKVGRDGLGEFMINSLRAHGIDAGESQKTMSIIPQPPW